MTAYSLAALDMAGTTVDEGGLVYRAVEESVAEAVRRPVPPALLAQWKGTSKAEAIAGILRGLGEDASLARVERIHDTFAERLTTMYRATPPAPIPGVEELFDKLRSAGVKVALQTGYTAQIAGAILEGLEWTVGEGADATVDALVTSDLVPASRPAPYLVFRCMEATGVQDVRQVLVAGDTPNDLAAGTNAGARFVVGVTTGSFTRAQLEGEPHTHVLDSIAEAITLL